MEEATLGKEGECLGYSEGSEQPRPRPAKRVLGEVRSRLWAFGRAAGDWGSGE